MKSFDRASAVATKLPSTTSASPYVEAISIKRPPWAIRALTSLLLLKTYAVPSPTAGKASPLLGINRSIKAGSPCAKAGPTTSEVAAPWVKPRRVKFISGSLLPPLRALRSDAPGRGLS